MKAGRRGGLCRVSLVGNALAARLLPCSAKKEIAFGNFGFQMRFLFGMSWRCGRGACALPVGWMFQQKTAVLPGGTVAAYFFFFRPNEKPNERRSL